MSFSQWKQHKMRWISLLLRHKSKRRNRLPGLEGYTAVSLETRTLPSIGAVPVQSSSGEEGIEPGPVGSFPGQLLNVNGTLYFTATDAVNGQELWRISSSGVAALVEDSLSGGGIRPGIISAAPSALTNVNGEIFFTADDGVNGRELWHVNLQGIAEMIEDEVPGGGIAAGATSSFPAYLTDVNGILYFRTDNGRNELGASIFELWRVNRQGAAERVGVFDGDHLSGLANLDGVLYFTASDGVNGRELWKVSRLGVPEMIEDSVPGGGIAPGGSASFPNSLISVNGTIYFSANDGLNGWELYRINAVGVAELVEDGIPGGGIHPTGNSFPSLLTNVGGVLYFRASDGINGKELWRTNHSGTVEMVEDKISGGGIGPGSSDIDPAELMTLKNVNGTLYFTADDGINGLELWRIADTGIAEMVEDSVAGGGIGAGSRGVGPGLLTNVNGVLFFSADDGINGRELWTINASGGAEIVDDQIDGPGINPGGNHSDPQYLTDVRGTLCFSAVDGVNGREFWRINQFGRSELIEDRIPGGGISPGSGTSGPTYWTDVDGVIYFSATDGTDGTELWALKTNAAPINVSLRDTVSRIQEDASTTLPIRIADIVIADDGLGINQISIVGPDAAAFEITDGKIFLKAGVRLHSQLKPVFVFQVLVDDPAAGDSPDIGVTGFLQVTSIVPGILAPAGITSAIRPKIVWTAVSGASSYDLWIRNDSAKISRFLLATVSGNEFTPDTDFGPGRFTLWVRSRSAGGYASPWSAGYGFLVRPAVILTTVESDIRTAKPELGWETLSGADSYEVWINNLSAGITAQIYAKKLPPGGWKSSTDIPMGRYRAWVRGIAKDGEPGAWSAPLTFTVSSPPQLISPLTSTFNRTPGFRWTAVAGAGSYELRVMDASGDKILHRVIQESTVWKPSAVLAGSEIRWQVRAIGAAGVISPFTVPGTVRIDGRPDVLMPLRHQSAGDYSFSWTTVDGATGYQIFVSRTSSPNIAVINLKGIELTGYRTPVPLPSGVYRIWVRAISSDRTTYGVWSNVLTLTVADDSNEGLSDTPANRRNVRRAVARSLVQAGSVDVPDNLVDSVRDGAVDISAVEISDDVVDEQYALAALMARFAQAADVFH